MSLLQNRYLWCVLGLLFGFALECLAVYVGRKGHGTNFLMYVASLPTCVLGRNQVWGMIFVFSLPPLQWLLVALCLHGSLVERKARWFKALIVLGAVILVFVPLEWGQYGFDLHIELLYRLCAGGIPAVLMIIGGVLLLRRARASA